MTVIDLLKKFQIAIAALLVLGMTAGCVHRINIQQGNFLDKEDVDRVSVGMTRVQVRALLGTPMLADPFHNERWDYLFYFKRGRGGDLRRSHFTVYFDESDRVARVEKPEGDLATLEPDPDVAAEAEEAESNL